MIRGFTLNAAADQVAESDRCAVQRLRVLLLILQDLFTFSSYVRILEGTVRRDELTWMIKPVRASMCSTVNSSWTARIEKLERYQNKTMLCRKVRRGTHFRAIVVNGSFRAPICSQLRSFFNAVNHSSTFMPVMFFLPVGVRNKLANVRRAKRVFVSLTLEAV